MRNPKHNDEFTDFDDQAETEEKTYPLIGLLIAIVFGVLFWWGVISLIRWIFVKA